MPTRKPPVDDDQLELFSAIFRDVSAKETQDTMEVPFLSLSKSPRFKPIEYKNGDVEITVSGGQPDGIANIFDWDLIIWLLSQVRNGKDRGEHVSRKIRFTRWAYLKDARRHTGGDEYRRLESSITRLKNTTVKTTIRAKGRKLVMFNWIEYAEIERDEKGRLRDATVVLPEWLFEAVCNHKLVLTLHRDYFLLTGGIERWLYRIIRKGAGTQAGGWKWKLETLFKRSGTTRPYKYFMADLRKVIKRGTLLDYQLELIEIDREKYLAARRMESVPMVVDADDEKAVSFLRLSISSYEKAKSMAPGHDVYALEKLWQEFNQGKESQIRNPDAAFVAFCKTHALRNPIPGR